ncbi:hypothetical protein ILYODFUR_037965 [Ilyodon furcidens]|uniref:Fibronectin type-III domain-containing protein n=1 Tax=Ilyodon furcidens TaxID=33524 RepID=A0ABV0U135_9TELE
MNKLLDGGRCEIRNLKPYEHYICGVRPIYVDRHDFKGETVKEKTQPGIPEPPTGLQVSFPENNVIKVTCGPPLHLNGPHRNYIVQLLNVAGRKQNKTSCDSEFKNLDYLTSYTVEVVIFNGHFNSTPVTRSAVTNYNDKALIGFLVVLIIITSVALLLVLYKIFVLRRRKSQ